MQIQLYCNSDWSLDHALTSLVILMTTPRLYVLISCHYSYPVNSGLSLKYQCDTLLGSSGLALYGEWKYDDKVHKYCMVIIQLKAKRKQASTVGIGDLALHTAGSSKSLTGCSTVDMTLSNEVCRNRNLLYYNGCFFFILNIKLFRRTHTHIVCSCCCYNYFPLLLPSFIVCTAGTVMKSIKEDYNSKNT